MTSRQKLLKLVYPLWMVFGKLAGRKQQHNKNTGVQQPITSFYELEMKMNDGSILRFSSLKGKKVLLVNTASDCGYTGQYGELQELHRKFGDRLSVIAFPSNDFKEQEKGSDEEIAAFCTNNYGVTFPLAIKSAVTGDNRNAVFRWLTDQSKNGWNDQQPVWNFSKFLVSEDGVLLQYFDPGVSPTSTALLSLLNK